MSPAPIPPTRPREGGPRLHLVPVVVAAILSLTAIPIDWRPPVWPGPDVEPLDFVLNVLLFAPLGVAAFRFGTARVLLGSALLSGTIELLQMSSVGRYPGLPDIIANVFGAAVGLALARRLARRGHVTFDTIRIGTRVAVLAAGAAAALVALWMLPVQPTDLSNWDLGYAVTLGDEATGDRGWRGTVELAAVLPTALPAGEVPGLTRLPAADLAEALARRDGYVFATRVELDGTAGVGLRDDGVASSLRTAAERSAFTVVARVTPSATLQDGPARILSFGRDPMHQNFIVGQKDAALVFRVRTPITGSAGLDPHLLTFPVLQAGTTATIVATFDGIISRVYVNGRQVGRQNLAAAGCAPGALCDFGLLFGSAVLSGAIAVIALALMVPASRRGGLAASIAGAAVTIATVRLTHAAFTAPDVAAVVPWSATMGAAAVLTAFIPSRLERRRPGVQAGGAAS